MDDYFTKHFSEMNVLGNVGGGVIIKWVMSLHTIAAFLWESQGRCGETLLSNYGHK